MTRILGLVFMLFSAVGCQHVQPPHPLDDVVFVDLAPTYEGQALAASRVVSQVDLPATTPVAGASWGSVWSPGGRVLVFDDALFCERHPQPLGAAIDITRYDVGDEVGRGMIKLDYEAAAANAVGSGTDLSTAKTWLVLTTADAPDERVAASEKSRKLAAVTARKMLESGVPPPIFVAVVSGDRDSTELILLKPEEDNHITDRLPVIVRGNTTTRFLAVLDDVIAGPETIDSYFDGLMVSVWHGEMSRSWLPPWEAKTERDKDWERSLEHILTGVDRGCTF